jgi:hypothetical protein
MNFQKSSNFNQAGLDRNRIEELLSNSVNYLCINIFSVVVKMKLIEKCFLQFFSNGKQNKKLEPKIILMT